MVQVLDYSLYNPPSWITQTSLQLSPYFPQVGDIVGHLILDLYDFVYSPPSSPSSPSSPPLLSLLPSPLLPPLPPALPTSKVVYCHQGHKLDEEEVKRERAYSVHKSKRPWEKYSLKPQEFCQVTNIRYQVGPPTVCSITVALVSPLPQFEEGPSSSINGEKSRVTFSFK